MSAEAEVPELAITYFTDPLCCWSWGMQPHLDSLQDRFGNRMTMTLMMGGLLPSWTNYYDEANSVSRPAQMGPVWMHAAQLTHRPVNYLVWANDPPDSSYPACIAVKCAALQSPELAMLLFRDLQQAVMQEGKNISKNETIQVIVTKLSKEYPLFNQKQFTADFLSDRGKAFFQEDLASLSKYGITRFPTLMITAKEKSILIPGYRTLHSLLETISTAFGISDVKKHNAEQQQTYGKRGL